MYPYYAIQIIGYGKNRKYSIKKVVSRNAVDPVNGKTYKTEEKARQVTAEMGITIEKVGDFYEII